MIEPGNFTSRDIALLLFGVAAIATAALLAWNKPWIFSRNDRLLQAFAPDAADAVPPLQFTRGDGNEHPLMPAAAALETMPSDTRSFGYGTRMPGETDFRGILHSQAFKVTSRYLAMPFTGFPCADGNGLRWRFFNPSTQQETWVSYVGPNPGVNWDMWSIDVAAQLGSEASVYLYDGREDQSGWVGVGQPAQINDISFGTHWLTALRSERTYAAQRALALLAPSALVVGILFFRRARASKPRPAH